LGGILLDTPWELAKLLALDLPVRAVRVDELAWQLDLPWWRAGDEWFAVTPNQVRADPERYADQWSRTMKADLDTPAHVRRIERGIVFVDGVHRLLRATVEARSTLPGRLVLDRYLAQIRS
jgi:hypothetical protein